MVSCQQDKKLRMSDCVRYFEDSSKLVGWGNHRRFLKCVHCNKHIASSELEQGGHLDAGKWMLEYRLLLFLVH